MPKGYGVSHHDPGNVGEQMLGRGDEKRSTKTFIEDGPLAMYLGLVQGFPDAILNMGRRLHAMENKLPFESVTDELILSTYPEARELLVLHQRIIEHKSSQSGFMVDRYVMRGRSAEEMEETKTRKESSGELSNGGNKRWS